ncbi:hypothetical protein [Paramicrobacterium agarici]|uniref:Uncharacterized protein n=1 Tax=Paramicrobacterium agarici TaxID=630514 RepID=A0A2A9DWS2_9MICO|nr:hypothetical protein [Microbacterium agarici]PFG30585.1 hypothetical protein ATJ78_1520 [Microbacterium agarici]TQO23603.1 hypothetical protein FB385_2460 [Microbacterium agarici]
MSSSATKTKPSTRKIAAFVLAALGIAGLSAASAANLALGSSTLGAGQQVVASCQESDADPIDLSFSTALSAGSYQAQALTLSNISDACSGLDYKVAVNGAEVATGSLDPITAGTRGVLEIPLTSTAAADVESVSVVIFN